MTSIRTFIAIELSTEARTALTDLQNRLKTIVPPRSVRWTVPQNIHLTLHFLGDVDTNDVEKISAVLDEATLAGPPFSLTLERLGCFPNISRPRIVWVGISGETETLLVLHLDLGKRLQAAIGFSPDSRPYSPHLTIGRTKKGLPARHLKQLSQALQQEQGNIGHLAPLPVTEIRLIKSELKPTGPVYTPLSRASLTPPSNEKSANSI